MGFNNFLRTHNGFTFYSVFFRIDRPTRTRRIRTAAMDADDETKCPPRRLGVRRFVFSRYVSEMKRRYNIIFSDETGGGGTTVVV